MTFRSLPWRKHASIVTGAEAGEEKGPHVQLSLVRRTSW